MVVDAEPELDVDPDPDRDEVVLDPDPPELLDVPVPDWDPVLPLVPPPDDCPVEPDADCEFDPPDVEPVLLSVDDGPPLELDGPHPPTNAAVIPRNAM